MHDSLKSSDPEVAEIMVRLSSAPIELAIGCTYF